MIEKALQVELQSFAHGFHNVLQPLLCTDLKGEAAFLQNKTAAYLVPFGIRKNSTSCLYRRRVWEIALSFFSFPLTNFTFYYNIKYKECLKTVKCSQSSSQGFLLHTLPALRGCNTMGRPFSSC